MGNLVNPVSLRLSYNCYWNNAWAVSNLCNYSYINMLDYCLFKYVSFMWDRLKWYRKGFIFFGFKFFRVFNYIYINFIIRHQKLYNKLLSLLKPLSRDLKVSIRKKWKNSKKFLKKGKRRLKIKYKDLQKSQIKRRKKIKLLNIIKKMKKLRLHITPKKKKTKIKNYKYKLMLTVKKYFVWCKKIRLKIVKYIIFKILNFYYFAFLKFFILRYLRKFFLWLNVKLNIVLMQVSTIGAAFIAKFIRVKLINRFPFRWVMKFILRRLRFALVKKYVIGFKILLSGRFSRKDRSTYYWKTKGKVSLNSVVSKIDYCLSTVRLLNSMCGIKVWINKKRNFRRIFVF